MVLQSHIVLTAISGKLFPRSYIVKSRSPLTGIPVRVANQSYIFRGKASTEPSVWAILFKTIQIRSVCRARSS